MRGRATGRHRHRGTHASRPRRERSPRARRPIFPPRSAGVRGRVAQAFPALLGPGRRAAWRRYCLRRGAAVVLALSGCGLVFLAGAQSALTG